MRQKTLLQLALQATVCACLMFSCKKDTKSVPDSIKHPELSVHSDDMVVTPYGLVPKSRVIQVDNKTIVKVDKGHLLTLDIATGKTIKDLGLLSKEELAANKANPYSYAAYLRSLNNGGRNLALTPGAKTTGASRNLTSLGTNYPGYYLGADNVSNIQSFSTDWIVPNKPLDTVSLPTTFLWNGLSGGALQPVLQWSEGQGPNYTIANWYFVAGNYFHGTFVNVSPGTKLTGVITFVSNTNDTTWTYKESFTGFPTADVTFVRTSEATGLSEDFEPYTSLMSQWPNQPYEAMTNINLTLRSGTKPDTLHWVGINDGPRTTPTGYNSVIVNNSSSTGEVRFYFGDGTSITPDSTYQINLALSGSHVLDVTGSGTANGTKVEEYTKNSPASANQVWKFVSLNNGYYKILLLNAPGKALDVMNAGTTSGTQVDIYTDNGTNAQMWKITSRGGGYYSLSPACAPSLVLDIYGSNTANGTKVELYTDNGGSANQKFQFSLQ